MATKPKSETPKESQSAPNPFDPMSLRMETQDDLGVVKVVTNVRVGKPPKSDFIRVHPDPEMQVKTAVLEDSNLGETYLIARELWSELAGETQPVQLYLAYGRNAKSAFFWPVKLPGPDGRVNHWHQSALQAAELATKSWVRIKANMEAGCYDVYQATGNLPEPEWPDKSLTELLELAFKKNYIDTIDHPVLKALRGEV